MGEKLGLLGSICFVFFLSIALQYPHSHSFVHRYQQRGVRDRFILSAVNKPISYIPIDEKPEPRARRKRKPGPPPSKQPPAKPFSQTRFIPLPNKDGTYNISDVPGFNGTQERTWEERYNELKEYKRVYKTFNVPRSTALGIWVTVQRYLIVNRRKKKTPAISEFQFQRLALIDFTKRRYRRPWKERYEDLVAYHAAFEHCDVPRYEIGGLGVWVNTQRSKHYNVTLGNGGPSKLKDWQVNALDKLNFQWMKLGQDTPWRKRYYELVAYKDKHKDTLVPYERPDGLGQWVSKQRMEYGHLCVDEVPSEIGERIDLLNEIYFVWDPLVDQWMRRYKELKAYKDKHGDTLVPHGTPDGLGDWVGTQRNQYSYFVNGKYSHMTQERIDLLNEIHFAWDSLEDRWMRRYKELKAYKDKHGNILVTQGTCDGLGDWVATQRVQYAYSVQGTDSHMTQERIDLLNEIHFAWDPLEDQWMRRYKELKAYQDKHGDTLVPKRARGGLGSWVATQRVQYSYLDRGKDSHMTQERIDLLNDIGFAWDAKEDQWMRRYRELRAYKDERGDTLVPITSHNSLGHWVGNQRTAYRQHCDGIKSMSQERIDRLNKIGFVWRLSTPS